MISGFLHGLDTDGTRVGKTVAQCLCGQLWVDLNTPGTDKKRVAGQPTLLAWWNHLEPARQYQRLAKEMEMKSRPAGVHEVQLQDFLVPVLGDLTPLWARGGAEMPS